MTKSIKLLLLLLSTFIANNAYCQIDYDQTIKPGDTRFDDYIPILRQKKVGLIINQTSVVSGNSLLDILIAEKINIVKIFVPEHGFRGKEDAGSKIDNGIDSATGIPILSLYGSHKKPKPEEIADIDIMVYDLQDVGVRFYTYISTLEYCMEASAENKKQFLVLDRPNPNGFYVDGPILEKENRSFVGMQQIPIVYGMTVGEYAKMLQGENWFVSASLLDLKVIKCENYTHSKKYKLPIAPSPNLRNMAAIYAYPSLCLFEGTVISVGRGTNLPFGQFGCPEFEGKFAYTFSPHSGNGAKSPLYENKVCYGVLIGDDDKLTLEKINNQFNLDWLIDAYKNYPDKEKFFGSFFKKLSGSTELEKQIKDGMPSEKIRATWRTGIDSFLITRKKYLLYP